MLNSSGQIAIGGTTNGQSINLELYYASNFQSSLDDTMLRRLAEVTSVGSTIKLSDFYGKDYNSIPGTLRVWGYNNSGQIGDSSTSNKSNPVQIAGTTWGAISGGGFHSASVKSDGRLWTWGHNVYGQLGDNTETNRTSPVQTISGGTNWRNVSCGYYHTAAIKTDGTLWTWGDNTYGQLGYTPSALRTIDGTTWVEVECGRNHTLAIRVDGGLSTLWLWGENTWGNLGDNFTTHRSSPVQTISGGTNWRTIGVGYDHTMGIKTDGTLWTWGHNVYGQLGNDITDNTLVSTSSPAQTSVGGTNWQFITGGYYHNAAIKTDGTLWTWGRNDSGQLGLNYTSFVHSPIQTLAGGSTWQTISAGGGSAAIRTDGGVSTLWVWGYNHIGQLGDGTKINKSSPVQTITSGSTWKDISSGLYFAAGIRTNGTLWTWGHNTYGQLGDGTTVHRSSPVQTSALGTNWSSVSCGNDYLGFVAATKTDGTLWTWGSNSYGKLGDGTAISKSNPTSIPGTNWKSVSAGGTHAAAIKTDNSLWLWGRNAVWGTLGDNTTITKSSPVQTITSGTTWASVSCGGDFTAAIRVDGGLSTLWLWGDNNYSGVLGIGSSTGARSSPIQTSAGGTNWKVVSSGSDNVTAVKTDGTLWAWGNSVFLPSTYTTTPQQMLPGTTNWRTVNSGADHFIALKTDGTLWSWGSDDSGSMGLGFETAEVGFPQQNVLGGTNWKTAGCGAWHIAAIKTDGTLWTWGQGGNHIGTGSTTNQVSPMQVGTATTWNTISCGFDHSAAIKTDGTLWTWGDNVAGQIGQPDAVSVPTQLPTGGTTWKEVDCGEYHTAAIRVDSGLSTLWLWGHNQTGQLGDGTTTGTSSPIQTILGGTNWKSINCGGYHTAAIKTDGTIWLFGDNTYGQTGASSAKTMSPVQTVSLGTNWRSVACGYYFTAAIKTDGRLWLWGNNGYGQLGNNLRTHRSSPVQTSALGTTWKTIAGGSGHVVAIKTDNTLWTWGRNTYGQLGNSAVIHRSNPVQIAGTDWRSASAGYYHTAAVRTDNSLWNWGHNGYGQLGDNLRTHRSSPIQTASNTTTWKTVTCGGYFTTATKTDNTLWTWGENTYGQLGNNLRTHRSSPIQTTLDGTSWRSAAGGEDHNMAVIFN